MNTVDYSKEQMALYKIIADKENLNNIPRVFPN